MQDQHQYLFQFSVGPVQGFIGMARKLHDLFAGSNLITELRSLAFFLLQDELEASKCHGHIELIAPYKIDKSTNSRIGSRYQQHLNKFQCVITADKQIELEKIGNLIVEQTISKWIEKAKQLLIDYNLEKPDNFEAQINAFLDLNWLAVRIIDNNYTDAYTQLENASASLKFQSNYKQFEETGTKCHNDHVLNIAFYRPKPNQMGKAASRLYLEEKNLTEIGKANLPMGLLDEGEGLSSMSFAKRMYLKEYNGFPSTARVALWHLLDRVRAYQEDEIQPFTDFKNLLVNNTQAHINEQLLYKDNLTNYSEFTLKYGGELNIDEQRFADLAQKREALCASLDGFPFTKYYAIVKFDGDQSGSWIRGANLTSPDFLKFFQKAYSRKLNEFVLACFEMLAPPKGQIIYAGEDFLAVVNLHHLFDFLDQLFSSFNKHFNLELLFEPAIRGIVKKEAIFSLSGGVVIAQYTEPLSEVLLQLNTAEKQAKDHSGKASMGLRFMSRSGTTHAGIISTNAIKIVDNYFTPSIHVCKLLVHLLEAGVYSSSFVFELIKIADKMEMSMPKEAFYSNLWDLLKRSFNPGSQADVSEKHSPDAIFRMFDYLLLGDDEESIVNFISIMKILDGFVTRKIA